MKTVVAGAVGANCGEANLTHCGPVRAKRRRPTEQMFASAAVAGYFQRLTQAFVCEWGIFFFMVKASIRGLFFGAPRTRASGFDPSPTAPVDAPAGAPYNDRACPSYAPSDRNPNGLHVQCSSRWRPSQEGISGQNGGTDISAPQGASMWPSTGPQSGLWHGCCPPNPHL